MRRERPGPEFVSSSGPDPAAAPPPAACARADGRAGCSSRPHGPTVCACSYGFPRHYLRPRRDGDFRRPAGEHPPRRCTPGHRSGRSPPRRRRAIARSPPEKSTSTTIEAQHDRDPRPASAAAPMLVAVDPDGVVRVRDLINVIVIPLTRNSLFPEDDRPFVAHAAAPSASHCQHPLPRTAADASSS